MVLKTTMPLQSIAPSEARGALLASIGFVGHVLGFDMTIQIMTSHEIPFTSFLGALVGSFTVVGVEMRSQVESAGEGLVTTIKCTRVHPLLDRLHL